MNELLSGKYWGRNDNDYFKETSSHSPGEIEAQLSTSIKISCVGTVTRSVYLTTTVQVSYCSANLLVLGSHITCVGNISSGNLGVLSFFLQIILQISVRQIFQIVLR
jgi:hypothetical protein